MKVGLTVQRVACACMGAGLVVWRLLCRPANLPERAKHPLHGRAYEKLNLLIYWFQESGTTYPTLQMSRTSLKRRLFNDKNDVFWMGFDFRILGGSAYWRRAFCKDRKAGLTVQRVACTCMGADLAVRRALCASNQLAWTCKESFARSIF